VTVNELVDLLARRDVEVLAAVLDPDVVLVSDGGGLVVTPLRPVRGADAVARLVSALVTVDSVLTVEPVNGRPGVVVRAEGVARAVIVVEVGPAQVSRIWLVLNPDKLVRWHRSRT
jgi:RNA polymerase sigma-70 factor (ECF subfamily)